LESGKPLLSSKGHTSQILAVSISPDGRRFATAGGDLSIKIWEYPQGEELGKLIGHKKPVTTLAFSPDGKLLASGSQDNQIFLWRLEPEISKTPFIKLDGHDFIVNQVFFSKTGKALISISKDKTMRLWEVKSGKMLRILHGDSTPLVAAALSPDGKLIALSNLTNDITILTFPTDIPELKDNTGDISGSGEIDDSPNLHTSESDPGESDKSDINLENLKDMEKLQMTAEELRAYAVTETEGLSTVQYEMQQRLNLLLKANNTCLHAAEMEKLALKILAIVPDDLAAYHALVKTSILKQDFTAMSLIVSSGYFAELDQELYDYISILEVRNIFDNFRFGLFDQSFVRQGNKQKIKLANCKGNPLSASLSGISRNLRYPVEFLKNINSIPRLIDLREFTNLAQEEFQNRMFAEIERILESRTPRPTSYLPRTPEERSEKVPVGILNLNLEKAQTWKDDGMTSFRLRKERGQWQTYQTDRDNRIVMHLPAGSYSLKFAGVLRETFFLIAGTQFDLTID
jgi:hypothetical protein